jgi:hypothetical protein
MNYPTLAVCIIVLLLAFYIMKQITRVDPALKNPEELKFDNEEFMKDKYHEENYTGPYNEAVEQRHAVAEIPVQPVAPKKRTVKAAMKKKPKKKPTR